MLSPPLYPPLFHGNPWGKHGIRQGYGTLLLSADSRPLQGINMEKSCIFGDIHEHQVVLAGIIAMEFGVDF